MAYRVHAYKACSGYTCTQVPEPQSQVELDICSSIKTRPELEPAKTELNLDFFMGQDMWAQAWLGLSCISETT